MESTYYNPKTYLILTKIHALCFICYDNTSRVDSHCVQAKSYMIRYTPSKTACMWSYTNNAAVGSGSKWYKKSITKHKALSTNQKLASPVSLCISLKTDQSDNSLNIIDKLMSSNTMQASNMKYRWFLLKILLLKLIYIEYLSFKDTYVTKYK